MKTKFLIMKTNYTNFTLMLSFVFLLGATALSYGQTTTVYSEDFSNQENKGAIGVENNAPSIDIDNVNWSIDIDNTSLTANSDWFKVVDDRMEGRDLDGEAIWYSPVIDISNYLISFSLDAIESGRLESSDYLITEYKLNNSGSWIVASNNGNLINDFSSKTVSQIDLSGTQIQIRVRMKNNSGSEYLRIDNVTITGTQTCATPAIYAVTGSDLEYCTGDTDTTEIGLNNSQTGITYQLLRDDTSVGSALPGTGSAIDFGDFSAAGIYTVEATRTDGGCTATMTGSVVITVNEVPTANFTVASTNVGINNAITFTNTSTGNNTYNWDFGDGSTSTDENPTHTYTTEGTYTVTVTATNDCGTDTKTETLTATVSYCDVSVTDVQYADGITAVEFGSINNTSGVDQTTGYQDFTNVTTTIVRGTTETIKVRVNTDGNYTNYTSVWIDWNRNGTFEFTNDPATNEIIDIGSITDNTSIFLEKNIDIPTNAVLGNTRMRVITRYGNWPTTDACQIIDDGEIEDYTIIIKEQANTWTGNDQDQITDVTKWSLGMVPDETQSIVIGDNADLKIIEDLKFISVTVKPTGTLTIEKTGSVTTTNDFAVENGGTVNMLSELGNGNGNPQGNTSAAAADKFSSLIVGGTATGDINYNRAARADRQENGNILRSHISSPVVGQVFNSDFLTQNPNITASTNGVNHIFLDWNAAGNTWAWLANNTTLPSGKGYLVGMGSNTGNNGGNSNFNIKFTGEIENDDVDIAVNGAGASSWNVLGNPYPAYLDMEAFMAHNMETGVMYTEGASTKAGIYAWTGFGNSTVEKYKVYNRSSTAKLLRPGQGFVVAINGTGNVKFKKEWLRLPSDVSEIDMQFSGRGVNSTLTVNDYVKLSLSASNLYPMETEIYFNNFGSNGLDVGYDTAVYGGQADNNFGIYTHLVEGNTNQDMAIQTLDHSNLLTHIVPLGINATAGTTLTISLTDSLLPENTTVYLEDRLANTWTVLSDADYTFTAAASLTTSGRFYIHFEDNSPTLSNTEFDVNNLDIKSIAGAKTILINGNLDSNSILELYDINGRKLLTRTLDNYKTTQQIDVSYLATAAYIVSVRNTTQKVDKQIIIN